MIEQEFLDYVDDYVKSKSKRIKVIVLSSHRQDDYYSKVLLLEKDFSDVLTSFVFINYSLLESHIVLNSEDILKLKEVL